MAFWDFKGMFLNLHENLKLNNLRCMGNPSGDLPPSLAPSLPVQHQTHSSPLMSIKSIYMRKCLQTPMGSRTGPKKSFLGSSSGVISYRLSHKRARSTKSPQEGGSSTSYFRQSEDRTVF